MSNEDAVQRLARFLKDLMEGDSGVVKQAIIPLDCASDGVHQTPDQSEGQGK